MKKPKQYNMFTEKEYENRGWKEVHEIAMKRKRGE